MRVLTSKQVLAEPSKPSRAFHISSSVSDSAPKKIGLLINRASYEEDAALDTNSQNNKSKMMSLQKLNKSIWIDSLTLNIRLVICSCG